MSKKVKTETKVKTKKRLDKVQFEESKKPFRQSKPLVIPVSPSRDRRLAGKTRRLARRAGNRG